MGIPGSGKPTDVDGSEATIKHKRKLINDYWQGGRPLALAVGLHRRLYLSTKKYVGQVVDQKGSQSGPRP